MTEPIQGLSSKASKFQSDKDIISSMPENVITNIMDRLEIEEAVRTSILSRGWRLKWTLLTRIVFNSDFFERLSDSNHETYYGRIIISRLLLQLKGALTKFFLNVTEESYYEDINSWVMFLSTKGIEDFTLQSWHGIPLKLPTHFFSCLKLKRVELTNCCIRPIPGFSGFPNLLSLSLYSVTFESYQCGEFLTWSPLLEVLVISEDSITGVVQHVELAKLENLKVLCLPLCKLDSMGMITSSSIFQLMGDFSKLQELTLVFTDCKMLAGIEARNNARTFLPCLKVLDLCHIDFSSSIMVSCAIELICGSSKLHTLRITAAQKMDVVPPPAFCSSEVDYSRMGQLQLRDVTFYYIGGWSNESCLIESLLSSSPFLKNVWILANRSSRGSSYNHKEVMFGIQLLKFHRASPLAEVELEWV
uniref:F-box/FBD/LRR-repeat protein At1g13570-like n=1 Tax=Erigeron canadensis TaxID=72917 RepID=UPI001CB92D91|nr:F-box/FBD/LRR-repeat protein At1g13570-like [Erigeron canadensis]